ARTADFARIISLDPKLVVFDPNFTNTAIGTVAAGENGDLNGLSVAKCEDKAFGKVSCSARIADGDHHGFRLTIAGPVAVNRLVCRAIESVRTAVRLLFLRILAVLDGNASARSRILIATGLISEVLEVDARDVFLREHRCYKEKHRRNAGHRSHTFHLTGHISIRQLLHPRRIVCATAPCRTSSAGGC